MNLVLTEVPLPLRLQPGIRMTDEQLLRFCAANDDLRIEREADGQLIVMTPAGNKTGRRNAAIVSALDGWAVHDGRGYAFDSSTGFTLPDGSVRSPDAAWVSAARWDALAEVDQERFSPLCPEFVIELRSPSDRLPELQSKMEQWLRNGVELAWLVDPVEGRVTIYRPGQNAEVHHDPNLVQGTGVMTGFELSMVRVWN